MKSRGKRIFIISNRLPITVKRKKDRLEFSLSVGGLASGLTSIFKNENCIWIGWPGLAVKTDAEKKQITDELKKLRMIPVFLSNQEIKKGYEGFCNITIWPLFHYFLQYTDFKNDLWEVYKQVNQKYFRQLESIITEDDIIWVHDYHLMLLPGIIREKMSKISIGYFLHIPFPSYELYRTLPWREEILRGLLGADLIGFHTYDYARHFLSAVNHLLDISYISNQIVFEQRVLKVDSFPLGIDYNMYADGAQNPNVAKLLQKHRSKLESCKIILSVDRLDYSKGIVNRLKAFSSFLEKYPQYKEQVSLFLIVVPSRIKVPQYQKIKQEIDREVGSINGQYNTISWIPVHYFYRSFNFNNLAAFYQLADIALVTPLRDGMNLVAKEYLASRQNMPGVLILSELAGAAIELNEALVVNPNNINDIVLNIKAALDMPAEEQRERLVSLQKKLERYTNHNWAEDFFERLREVKKLQETMEASTIDRVTIRKIFDHYQSAKKRLFFLDYDGTLVNFSKDPQKVAPDDQLLKLITDLSMQNTVVIVSGRDKDTLEKWLGSLDKINLIAEHGAWFKDTNSTWQLIESMSNEWKREIQPVLDFYVRRTPGSFIEEKDYSLVWHYRKTVAELGNIRARELVQTLRNMASTLKLQVLEGNMIVEVKNYGINKGRAVSVWVNRINPDFIMAIGDDRTDEDIFTELNDRYTIKVGIGTTAAKYRVKTPEEVRNLLKTLVQEDSDKTSS